MDDQRKRDYALELAQQFIAGYDFIDLAEDEDLAADGATDNDLEDIFDLIINATVVIPDVDEP